MPKRSSQFQTIRTEGAILPPDILRSIAALAVDGVSADSYHLPPSTKLNEAISQAWTALLAHWKAFREAREKLPAHEETGTAVTNERWLLPLFKELDYGRLTTSKSPEIDGRTYSIERFYQHTPIHLIGCNLPLDRRTRGARGAATASPHSMMQEYLNRAEHSLWGFLSNGLSLRILRDNVSLSRQAYVEFDVEAMFDGEVYSDFALLWMLCHQSRVEAEKAQDCWLEKWSKLARDRGTRVLDELRVGVTSAIEALGRGFIAHPKNDRLRDKLRTGALTRQDYYRQLLRIVYRLLFLFVAEDRGLLHPPDAGEGACKLFDEYYSTARLRELCRSIRGSKHGDLWHTLSLVFDALGSSSGLPQLGLPVLGSFLWRRSTTADLVGPAAKSAPMVEEPVNITNDDLLSAVRALAYVQQDKVLRDVDYRNLGSEELGSVYESLLELHPEMNIEGRSFSLSVAAGHERKTTGSYYTPDSLVQCLLDSALEPVVAERIKGLKADEAERAILRLTVCDPACGSGHFLIAAAHRLARHLARVRTGETEPSPEDHQHALRDIIGRCIYGVDLNPMAVELCKVNLWVEALEPGRPLAFLDHHIQCGNSLLGAMPSTLAAGIPDDAFDPIEGDVKTVCSELKRENKKERQEYETGQGYLFAPSLKLGNLPATFAALSLGGDDSLSDIEHKQYMYEHAIREADYLNARLLADTWCATFVWHKDNTEIGKLCPTERDFRRIEANPHSVLPHVMTEIQRLANQYQFFHWQLAFPNIFHLPERGGVPEKKHAGWSGGFDIVIGNPPWENTEIQEIQFFSTRDASVAQATTASARKKLIKALQSDNPHLFADYIEALRFSNGISHLAKHSGTYPLSAHGRLNTYALFTELSRNIIGNVARMGLIVPTGIATDDNLKFFIDNVISGGTLVCLLGFENEEFLFPGIANVVRFCVFVVSGSTVPLPAEFAFYLRQTSQLAEYERIFTLTVDDITLLNPNTRTCPVFRTVDDAELTKAIYRRVPVMADESTGRNPWGIELRKGLYNMASDSNLFKSEPDSDACPLYEGKMLWHFDHRFSSYDLVGTAKGKGGRGLPSQTLANYENINYAITPRFWVSHQETERRLLSQWKYQWLIAIRDITSAKLERTCVATVIPRTGVGDTAALVFPLDAPTAEHIACFLANINSIVYDYVVRQKIGGTHLTSFVLKQTPVIPFISYTQADIQFISSRVLELVYTSMDVKAFGNDLGCKSPPYRWDERRRGELRAELDAYFAHLYGLTREDLQFVLCPQDVRGPDFPGETFRVLKEKEVAEWAEFRTGTRVLAKYDLLVSERFAKGSSVTQDSRTTH